MTEQFELPITTGSHAGRVELFKSYRRFETYFQDATRMRVVTYCDSPKFIIELFDRVDSLEHLEVVVGDKDDYRENLVDLPELADRLEQLKQEGKLVIYLCENKEVHSKLYLIEYGTAGSETDSENRQQTFASDQTEVNSQPDSQSAREATVIVGSPNLSKNAWTKQANAGVVFDLVTNADLWDEFNQLYEEHKSYNKNGPFLQDLTDRLKDSSDDREQVIQLYTEGKMKTRDEVGEIHGRLDEHIESEADRINLVFGEENGTPNTEETSLQSSDTEESDTDHPETRINLSLVGHSEDAVETVSRITDYDASLSDNSLTATPQAVHQYKRDVYEVPTMRVTRDSQDQSTLFGNQVSFHADGQVYDLGQPLPDDPKRVDDALDHIESYFRTVDEYGNSNDPDAVKAHMAEALLWVLWAPFANRDAQFYEEYGIDLDKALPNLYIYGESDAGKGTFAQFALSLISGGRVKAPVDADEVGKRKIRAMRSANTAFPVVVDDITKDTVNRLDTFRNYWTDWVPTASYPLFAFISNDKRPDEWFRNRAKILHFDVNFDTSYQGEAEVNQLIERDNPLFVWFAHELLSRELQLVDDDDPLRLTREVFLDLYKHANRSVPSWFPQRPAEREHDTGRERWVDLLQREDITTEDQGDRLRVSFPEEMSTDTYAYARDPPTIARVERRGTDLLIKSPEEFIDWLGEVPSATNLGRDQKKADQTTAENEGMFTRIRELFR